MIEYLAPVKGFLIGIFLIIFKENVSRFFQKAFEKFPKYGHGVASLNMKFGVRPCYIVILGLLFILVAVAALFETIVQMP